MDKKSILKVIADNQPLFEEVKKIIEDEFNSLPLEELELSDKELGERVRARLTGIETIKKVFEKILTYKTYDKPSKDYNPAK